MKRTTILLYVLLILAIVWGFAWVESQRAKKVNWSPSYVSTHRIPYGTKVFHDLLKQRFGDRLRDNYRPPYERLQSEGDMEGTLLIVNESLYLDEVEASTLLDWVAEGNTLFLAGHYFGNNLMDSLGLASFQIFRAPVLPNLLDSIDNSDSNGFFHRLENPYLDTVLVGSSRIYQLPHFERIDTLRTEVLGTAVERNDEGAVQNGPYANFVRTPYGSGTVYLNLFPEAFTNFMLLRPNGTDYALGVLSYLDDGGTLWVDHHHRNGKARYASPLYVLLGEPALKWGYYLILIGALLYVVFDGKRKQRAIRIVAPLRNRTLEFTRTVADMYFDRKDNRAILEHRVAAFMDYLRSRYHISTERLDDAFFHSLALRSAKDEEEVRALFRTVERLLGRSAVTDRELMELNQKFERFNTNDHGKR